MKMITFFFISIILLDICKEESIFYSNLHYFVKNELYDIGANSQYFFLLGLSIGNETHIQVKSQKVGLSDFTMFFCDF